MKKINYLYLLSLFFVFQSCTNELNVAPEDDDDFLSEAFFATPNAYEKALAGVYGNLSLTGTTGPESSYLEGIDAGTSQYSRCLWYMQELSTDEAIWSYEGDGDPGVREIQRNIWNGENPIFLGMYSRGMVEIAIVNEFLRQTTSAKLSARGITDTAMLSKIELYRNESRAVRALAYYHLMDLYGKATFVTENDPINFRGPQYNRAQLFTYIESELNSILPSLKAPRTNIYGRLDKGFAWMILAKMYLNAEVYIGSPKYVECLAQCNNIIGGSYSLKPNYLDNFNGDNHTSEEMIFTIQSDGITTQNYGATTVMCNGQVGSIEGSGIALFGVNGWGGALRLRKQFVEKFSDAAFDFDSRKTIFLNPNDPDVTKRRFAEISDITNKSQGALLRKYSNIKSTGQVGPSTTFVDTDFPLFRLGDVYLMYVEAQMRKDGATNGSSTTNATAQSFMYFNALRERANGGNFANATMGQINLDYVLDERARELHWEGHRRQDLIRFNKFTGGNYNWAWKGNGSNGIAIADYLKLYPLHPNTINANPNLTQNTGY